MPMLDRYQKNQLVWLGFTVFMMFAGLTTKSDFVRGLAFTTATVAILSAQYMAKRIAAQDEPASVDERRKSIDQGADAFAFRILRVAVVVAIPFTRGHEGVSGALVVLFAAMMGLPLFTGFWLARRT